jgi:hypothetical protein
VVLSASEFEFIIMMMVIDASGRSRGGVDNIKNTLLFDIQPRFPRTHDHIVLRINFDPCSRWPMRLELIATQWN